MPIQVPPAAPLSIFLPVDAPGKAGQDGSSTAGISTSPKPSAEVLLSKAGVKCMPALRAGEPFAIPSPSLQTPSLCQSDSACLYRRRVSPLVPVLSGSHTNLVGTHLLKSTAQFNHHMGRLGCINGQGKPKCLPWWVIRQSLVKTTDVSHLGLSCHLLSKITPPLYTSPTCSTTTHTRKETMSLKDNFIALPFTIKSQEQITTMDTNILPRETGH